MYSSNSAMNTALAGAYLAEEDKRRREAEGQPRQDNLLDTIGKIALAAGATTGAVVAGRRLAGGQNTSATFDLSKVAGEGVQNIRRAAAAKIAPKDVVPPSRPVPTTGVERQRQVVEDTIRARSERPQGIVTVDLPQPKTAFDPWTGRETITDPFGVATVPPGPNIREMSFVLGDLPEPTEAELARVLSKAEERSYPSAPLTRQQVFSTTAAKPESALPRVYRPKGGIQDLATEPSFADQLITDPNTGEIFRRGQSPESFKETYISLRPALTGQRTDLPQGRTPGTFAEFSQDVSGASAAGRLLEDPELLQLVRQQRRQEGAELGRESQRQSRIAAAIEQEADQALSSIRGQANTVQAAGQENFASQYLRNEGYTQADTLVDQQVSSNLNQVDQFVNAVNSAEDQQTGRVKLAFQRNEDENLAAIELAEDRADARLATLAQASPESAGAIEVDAAINTVASQRPDGMPLDQAEGLKVLDLRNKQAINLSLGAAPRMERIAGISQESDDLTSRAQEYLRRQQLAQEIDTDFDYSAENRRQAAQVRDRIQWAQDLKNQAEEIIAEARGEVQPQTPQLSPEDFAKDFNRRYREEVNPELKLVDNARQRQELRGAQAGVEGEDVVSLLLGDVPEVETTMRGKALRGGKLNRAGDISYMDESGLEYASADTGVKARQGQGVQYKEHVLLTNEVKPLIGRASDEELTSMVLEGQDSPFRQALKERVAQKFTRYQDPRQLNLPIDLESGSTSLDNYLTNLASQTLVARALKNPEPTALQTAALNRARASVAASEEIRQQARIQSQQRPTIAPGPAQDLARSMETLRRGMIVEPSEPLPVMPSVQQMRAGFVTDVDPDELKRMTKAERLQLLGPVVSAPEVYTGAAAEAAGPVIFTGKSKANTVLATPPITGSVDTPTGRYLTQENPDVLGTVYKVAGTPANRAISRQVESNAQAFLADALAGGLQQKAIATPEPYKTPGIAATNQLELYPEARPQATSISPMSLKGALGLTGPEASQRTGYAQYQPGRSVPGPRSPFIGEMAGGTVVVVPPTGASTGTRRDIGAPTQSIDLTRRGERARYFSLYPEERFITGQEPAPIGPLTQSPGLSRIGGMTKQTVRGAGEGVYVTQLTPQGQRIAYPRMDKPVTVPGYKKGSTVTNIPRYGINPGAEDWREDLMRSEYRRGGPIRTSAADPRQLGITGRGLDLLLEYLNTPRS